MQTLKEKAVSRQEFMVKMSYFSRKPGKNTVLMDEQKYICLSKGGNKNNYKSGVFNHLSQHFEVYTVLHFFALSQR